MKIGDLVRHVSFDKTGTIVGLPKEQRYLCIKSHPFYTVLWSDGTQERTHINNVKVVS